MDSSYFQLNLSLGFSMFRLPTYIVLRWLSSILPQNMDWYLSRKAPLGRCPSEALAVVSMRNLTLDLQQ